MKRIISVILILIGFITDGFSVARYIGAYQTTINYSGNNILSRSPYYELYTTNKKAKITVQQEIVSTEKSSAIKASNVAAAFSGIAMAASAANTSLSIAHRNPIAYYNSVCTFKDAEAILYIAAMHKAENTDMFISVTVENLSDDEISISNRFEGSVYYILPGETIVFNNINAADFSFRFQYDLSNISNIERDYIDISTEAHCIRVDREAHDSDCWIIKEKTSGSKYLYTIKDLKDRSPYVTTDYHYYYRLDLKTYEATPILLTEVKEVIKSVKANNKDKEED